MDHPPLIVMTASPASSGDCEALLRRMRRITHGSRSAVLLLCDLPDARTQKAAGDEALLRLLQSGVMSMERRAPGQFMLLVRSRVFDDAQRMYLGASQPAAPGQTAAQLLVKGVSDVRFDAATISPSSLKERASCVLILSRDAVCTPDVPLRMQRALLSRGDPCACGRMVIARREDEPILDRLLRGGFSFSPLRAAANCLLAESMMAVPDGCPALMLNAEALSAYAEGALPARCPVLTDCPFLLLRTQSAGGMLLRLRASFSAALSPSCGSAVRRLDALLPLLRAVLLMISAAQGLPLLAAAAVFLPEAAALYRPRLLPGALVRLSLLPACAFLSLDALLRRLLARSPLLRVELPSRLAGGGLCAASGALLFAAALRGNHALAALTSVSLLFAAAPLILRALDSPVSERIPLTAHERSQMHAMAQSAFLRVAGGRAPSPRLMLCDCAGCMLGLLEPDEAARRIQARMEQMGKDPVSAAEAACMLAAAQYIREHMGECDAGLRALPPQLEARLLSLPLCPQATPLARMLRAALSAQAIPAGEPESPGGAAEALFLPSAPAYSSLGLFSEQDKAGPLAPLLAPHTFLQAHPDGGAPAQGSEEDCALILAEAALGRPFLALFLRSPLSGPYAPLLFARDDG